jgi:hypothetical protein
MAIDLVEFESNTVRINLIIRVFCRMNSLLIDWV